MQNVKDARFRRKLRAPRRGAAALAFIALAGLLACAPAKIDDPKAADSAEAPLGEQLFVRDGSGSSRVPLDPNIEVNDSYRANVDSTRWRNNLLMNPLFGREPGIEEPSGVTRHKDHLYIVGDDEHGAYFEIPLPTDSKFDLDPDFPHPWFIGFGDFRRIPLSTPEAAADLEGVGVLADGRVVALSEARRALFDEQGIVTTFDPAFTEFGGRGLEGLAIHHLGGDSSRVTVVWEGGYPGMNDIPAPLRSRLAPGSLRPVLYTFDLGPGERRTFAAEDESHPSRELQVPTPLGNEPAAQRFRCPDLVCHSWTETLENETRRVDGYICLLTSGPGAPAAPGSPEECGRLEDGKRRKYCYKWLQRFRADGTAFGEPYDLDEIFSTGQAALNWEGLGWFEPGRSLVLVYDEKLSERKRPQSALVISLPPDWAE